jgi:outer membrane protein assembly factor BamE (lipoprotein component of BamABCDE complex)
MDERAVESQHQAGIGRAHRELPMGSQYFALGIPIFCARGPPPAAASPTMSVRGPSRRRRRKPSMKFIILLLATVCVTGCALERAQMAQDARTIMVGFTKEQVLACMGPPASRATEGATEVWSYQSGNGRVTAEYSGGTATSTQRFCTVNVTMASDKVTRINYLGPTGGFLSAGEQCAFAIQNCTKP